MKTDTVIFDLDGTLLDTLEDLADSVNEALFAFGMPLRTLEEVRDFVGNGVAVLMKKAVPEGTDETTYEAALLAFKKAYMKNSRNKTKLYSGIIPLIDSLDKMGIKIAIVSNKIDEAVKELNKFYLGERIKVAVGDREGTPKKPSPELVNIALKELGSGKENALYVGDSEVDIKTAENAGMPCVSVSWGFRKRDELISYGAENIIDEPYELVKFIDV